MVRGPKGFPCSNPAMDTIPAARTQEKAHLRPLPASVQRNRLSGDNSQASNRSSRLRRA